MLYKSYLIENNINNLKERISLFYGENLGLKNEFKSIIKKNNSNSEILFFSQDEILQNNNVLIKEINNVSLFEKSKVFLIENINDKFLDLVIEIEKIIADNKLFFFLDILEKKSKLRNYFEKSKVCAAIPCYADNDLSLKKLIQSKLEEYSGLTGSNINMILDSTNLDRAKLNNELEKIKTLFQDKIIKSEKLDLLLNNKSNEDFNKLKDQAFLGNKIATNKLLSETIIDNEKNIFYLNMINQRLYKISETLNKDGKTVEAKINSLKPPIFWKDKPHFLTQAKKWDKEKLNSLLKKTYEIEKTIKSNSFLNKQILLKELVINICETANS
mgnify:CR=1 FL=1